MNFPKKYMWSIVKQFNTAHYKINSHIIIKAMLNNKNQFLADIVAVILYEPQLLCSTQPLIDFKFQNSNDVWT